MKCLLLTGWIATAVHAADKTRSKAAKSTHHTLRYVTASKNHWGIRQGKWKLVHLGGYHLFDLSRDVSETNNLATQHPEIVQRLVALNEKERRKGCYRAEPER